MCSISNYQICVYTKLILFSAVCQVSDYAKSTKLLASTTLRTLLGTRNLAEILSDREHIAREILEHLDTATDPWGIQVGTKIL